MSDSQESSMEHVQEHIHHGAHESHGHKGESWIGMAALSAAIFAALAAIGGAISSENLNEAAESRLVANDLWGQYQAKSIKQTILITKVELLEALEKPKSEKDAKKIEDYDGEKKELKTKAEEEEAKDHHCTKIHTVVEYGVTLLHISIAVVAIAVLSKRRRFWLVSLVFATGGAVLMVYGFLL